jgi:hypothetical protein
MSTTDARWSNQKYQTIFPASTLGSVPGRITALSFVPRSTGHRQFSSIRIKFNQMTASTMTTSFAGNLGTGATTVLDNLTGPARLARRLSGSGAWGRRSGGW